MRDILTNIFPPYTFITYVMEVMFALLFVI